MLGKPGAKKHRGQHKGDCPSRSDANPNGVTHRQHCNELPRAITEAPAPSGQGSAIEDLQAKLSSIADAIAGLTNGDPAPKGPRARRGRGGPQNVQPEAEKAAKPETKVIALGESQPNGAWFEPLSNGLTAYGFCTMLAKLNKNYGRIEFAEPSSYDDGGQVLCNKTPYSIHGAALGEAKVNQGWESMSWPLGMDIYDVLSEMDGWDRSLLPASFS